MMPALVAGISLRDAVPCFQKRDGRDKPGHDGFLGLQPFYFAGVASGSPLRTV